MKKIAIIFNPKAGSGGRTLLKRIMQKLSSANKVELFETKAKGDATEIAKRESEYFDIIVVAGGDGTINEVINGIDLNKKLGIIPLGTANVLAIEAGIKNDVQSICALIEQATAQRIYIPTINNKKFLLMTGIGYDADIIHHTNPYLKKIFGKATFVFLGLMEWFKLKKYTITVEADQHVVTGNWVLITNAKHYAGPYKITNSTTIFQDNIVCYVFNNLSRIDILYYIFLILFYGDLNKSKKITKIISKNIKISSLDKINVQCDGEKYGTLPVEIYYKSETVRLIS